MGDLAVIGFILGLGLLVINPLIAERKGYSPAIAFFLSLLFAPLVYLYLLAVPPKPPLK